MCTMYVSKINYNYRPTKISNQIIYYTIMYNKIYHIAIKRILYTIHILICIYTILIYILQWNYIHYCSSILYTIYILVYIYAYYSVVVLYTLSWYLITKVKYALPPSTRIFKRGQMAVIHLYKLMVEVGLMVGLKL